MRQIKRKGRSFLLPLFIFLLFSEIADADKFMGTVSTGIFQLEGYRYPVYVYVPENYKPDRDYPLIVTLPGDAETAEKTINEWAKFGKRRSAIVLVSGLKPRDADVPFQADRWLLSVKKDVSGRYRVAADKTFLVGKDSGAHYAAYLGMRYPEEFAAVALLEGSWVGPFQELASLQSRPRRQNPFFVAITKRDDPRWIEKTKARALQLEQKGYPVYIERYESGEDLLSVDFKNRLFRWLEEKGGKWQQVIRESEKTLKEKIALGIEDFVSVK